MARAADANAGSSSHGGAQQQQQSSTLDHQYHNYHHQQPAAAAATQAPETIDDAPPPFESSMDENQQEVNYYENELQQKQPQPENNVQQPTPSSFPPPQNSRANVPQSVPPQNPTQMRSAAGAGAQGQPQAFPPPQDFPPQSQPHHHHSFPPSQSQPQAFPPPQGGQPHAFPPPQHDQPQAFPPHHSGKPEEFPPPHGGHQPPQGFSHPQPQPQVHAFPPQQGAFQHQNVPQYQNQPHFANVGATGTATTGVGQSPMHHGMPNSRFVHVQPNNPHAMGNPAAQGFPVPQAPVEPWESELFGCMDDPTNAVITACFPCVTFGQIAEIIDSGQTTCATSGMIYGCIAFLIAMPCLLSCTYRTKLRARYGLMETPAPDWIIHCFCEWCALCQEYRELQRRGFDPAIGWLGNVARSQHGAMTPPMRQNMMG